MTRRSRAVSRTLFPSFRSFRSLEKRVGLAVLLTAGLLAAPAQPVRAHEFEAGPIAVGHPWSRATPAGARVAAGYLTLKNAGATPDRLVSVTAEIAGRAEIHEMAVDAGGVMTMRPLGKGLEVPAGGEVALAPGSLHIMFEDLKSAPVEGKPFKGTLTFERAGTVDVEFVVEPIGGAAGDRSHSKMNHGG